VLRRDHDRSSHLIAYVVAGESAADDLRPFLRDRLPELHDSLGHRPARRSAADGERQGRSPPSAGARSCITRNGLRRARTPTEIVIARIWTNVLQVERTGSLDNFSSWAATRCSPRG